MTAIGRRAVLNMRSIEYVLNDSEASLDNESACVMQWNSKRKSSVTSLGVS